MWHPDPSWRPMPAGRGSSTGGLWLARAAGRDWVVKRLNAPIPGDPPELLDPTHFGYWRREAEVAATGVVARTPGLRSPTSRRVDEDQEGVCVWAAVVPEVDVPGPWAARCLGRFAAHGLPALPWLARDLLAGRIARAQRRGGWPVLARTALADLAGALWDRRGPLLDAVGSLPLVPSHGDVVPANLRGRAGDDLVAVDWSGLGLAPLGADLGYLSLSAREVTAVLLDAYLEGLASEGMPVDRGDALLGARVMAAFTVVSRAEWALARADRGTGPLEATYRHPSVAPYLRALQRALPDLEPLL